MDAIDKKFVEQCFRDVAFISNEFPKYLVMKVFILQGFAVIYIGLCEKEIQDFTFVIYNDMQLEPKEPAHGTLSFGCKAFESFVLKFAPDVANPDGGGIDKRNTGAFAKTAQLQENRHGHQRFLLQFNKACLY
jgi:hypothetical protein